MTPEPLLDRGALTPNEVNLVELQLKEVKATYENAMLKHDIIESKIKSKTTELKGLEAEFDVHVEHMQTMEREVGKWRAVLHKSGNSRL